MAKKHETYENKYEPLYEFLLNEALAVSEEGGVQPIRQVISSIRSGRACSR